MAYRGLLPDEFLNALDPTERGQLWAEALVAPRPGVTRLVICPDVGKEPVGFAVVGPVRAAGDNGSVGGGAGDSGLGELHAINLDPDSWGCGLGRELLAAATDELSRLGFGEAGLWVVTGTRGLAGSTKPPAGVQRGLSASMTRVDPRSRRSATAAR